MAPTAAFRFSADEVLPALTLFRQALRTVQPQVRDARHAPRMDPVAADPVSRAAARAFTAHGQDSALLALTSYQDRLQAVVEALTTAARQYGHTEDEIARTFRG
ncbi:PE domain-containing protein [Kutzneria albida]|uniref:PE domain-containing protein n=1 Tax=Kutzneria albida DSM 43870 TaxID=1449976 RepID=W5WMV1_9PSEU|nr:PE domain-containing protein [Kutzneria albida]AHI02163.1 hypothetical protein KALB_8806 [Kutzneria albida DSM 43870]